MLEHRVWDNLYLLTPATHIVMTNDFLALSQKIKWMQCCSRKDRRKVIISWQGQEFLGCLAVCWWQTSNFCLSSETWHHRFATKLIKYYVRNTNSTDFPLTAPCRLYFTLLYQPWVLFVWVCKVCWIKSVL